MIRVTKRNGTTSVTFALPIDEAPQPVSVVGDFNGWDPLATPLRKRSNGTRSARVDLTGPMVARFKYLADGGEWFNDPDAHGFEVNEYGETNSVLAFEVD
ncbi:MAG: isoamylase early set domain-containing protein [Actinomycetota bacterium]